MTSFITMSWRDFTTVNAAPVTFENLIMSVLSDNSALQVELNAKGVSLSAAPASGSVEAVSLSGFWMTPQINIINQLPLGARLLLPLIFRIQTAIIPSNAISNVSNSKRTIASVLMRNVFHAIVTGMDVQYLKANADFDALNTCSRDLAIIYQHILAKELDEPTIEDRDFLEMAMTAVYFDVMKFSNPILAIGRNALSAQLSMDAGDQPPIDQFIELRKNLFNYF